MRFPTSLFLLSLLLATAPGCDGQAPADTADTGGDISFLLDGEEWAVGASVQMIYTPGRGYGLLTDWTAPGDPALSQFLIFSLPRDLSERSYPLATYVLDGNGYATAFWEYAEDDYPYSAYESIGAGDALVVTRYDAATGELEATFEGTFADRPNRSLPRTLPDTFRVTQGRIQVTLTNPQDVPR